MMREGQVTSLTIASALAGLGMALVLASCSAEGGGDGQCTGKCDGFDSSDLEGRSDPIAVYLRDSGKIGADGLAELDYREVLFGVADQMGCGAETIKTFVVSDDLITLSDPFPRLISVACGDDDSKASDFFIAASFKEFEDGFPTGDVDLRDVEMFAWDRSARQYRFYAFRPHRSRPEKVKLEVDPPRCQGCHLTPSDTDTVGMRMTPIMNEINRPWTHWNAEPGFPSHRFVIPDGMEEQPNYAGLAVEHRAPAQRFEEIIRFGGHSKVANARLRDRRNPPNLDEIMGLLRPVFCAEQVNYVSEDHDSGVVFNAALVDPGIRNMYIQIRPNDWAWDWVNDETMRMSPPTTTPAVHQIPVRGNADATVENQLVSTKVLTPHQVLRVRALDWKNPAFSEFRCGLWRDAYDRLRASPPDFGDATRSLHVMPEIFEEIMQIDGQPLHPGGEEEIIAMADAAADADALIAALADPADLEAADCESDGSGFCVVDVDGLATMLQRYVDSVMNAADPRQVLVEERSERICHVTEEIATDDPRFEGFAVRFQNRPSLPDPGNCP